MKKIGLLRFPGTNCDRDVAAFVQSKNYQAQFLWHLDQFNTADYEAVILPGGFSYGDYLRSGALAARAPVMNSLKTFIDQGKPVLGICNGFQILCEAGFLPGSLVKNEGLRFVDDWVDLELMNSHHFFAKNLNRGDQVKLPVAHGDGRFYAQAEELKKIEDEGLVWLRYKNNPNGSLNNIAGVMNKKKNVVALMPHPERALYEWMGGMDGGQFL